MIRSTSEPSKRNCEVVDAWMDGSMAADVEETVLYELLVRAEWPCEHEAQPWASNELVTTTFVKKLCSSLSVPWWFVLHYAGYRHISSSSSLSAGLVRLSSLQMNWKLMLSSNLKLLAVIQDQNIEIRSSKDDFGSVVGRCAVPRDAFPQWRNICWNWDGTLLAHSDSSGHVFIFDLIGNLLFNIVPAAGCTGDLSQAVAGMVFLKCDDDRWSAQLLVITFHGLLTSYLIGLNTSQGYKETHRFSFRHQYPRGINTAVYNPAHRVLLVVGSKSGDAGTSATEACGLTLWRVLSGPPHYKLIESDYVDVGKSQLKVGWWRWFGAILPASRTQTHDAILKLSLSPSGASLAALHESGKLSLWNVPSMTLRHTWHQEQQPDFDVINPVWRNPVNRRTKIPGLASVPLLLDVKWWSEDALILVRCSGALTISSCVDLQNLLGRSCEWFEPSPAISAAFDGGFLTLECESKHSYLKRPRPDKHGLVGQQKDNDGEEEEEEEKRGDGEAEESSVMSRCGRLVRHSLYYVTESERFSPPRKRPRSMVHTYRLIKLKSTTPQELYQRKIDSEEYGEALQLAQVYGLDTDLVYQQQWRRKPVSIISIQDYLTKIRKPEWVLHECLERVPENVDAAKELLLYGLEGTGLDALMALADGERHDRFVIPGDLDLPEISYEDLEGEPEIEEELLCRRQQEREKWLLARVNFSNLTLGQRDLCRCRLRLLNFLERLTTYEEILGGPQAAEHLYNAEFFKTFRSQNLLVSARNYARSGDWQALETLFLFHGEELRKQRLPLLSCFPETTSPHEYRTLLPEVGFWSNGQDKLEVIPLQQHKHREPDWSENMELRALLEVRSGDLCEFIFEEEPELRPFCGDDLSVEQVSSWYRQRACHIEAHSHQVDCALSLLRLGVERGVPGLDDLLEELVTLETLVYEAGAEPTFTLENLQQMEDVARLRLLMLNVSVGDFVRDAFRWLVPFLQRVQARDGSSNSLLHQYLLGLASNDLTCPRLVFQNSTPVRVQRVITDDALLMELALECVYACTRTDQLALCYDILECLPQRKPRKDSKVMKTLHDRVDLLERHLRVVDILEKYGVHRPVSYVRDSQSDVELAQDLLTYLARLAGRRKPALTESQWEQLLQDMLEMQQTVYTCMRPEVCREIYVESLLCSGRIETLRLAGQRLQCLESSVAQGRHVLYKRSLQLVLQAAREYFNSASSHKDENLELARECLNLIKDHPPAIQEEQDLILSLSLLSEFHVKALPLQVRLCEDRLQLIKQCISQSPTIYKCPGKLLLLASLLRVPDSTGDNCGGPVLILLAEQALHSEDVAGASLLCQQLVKKGYQGAWSVCSRVGSCNDCTDTSIRRNFLTFALAHCPPDFLQDLLVKSCSLQAQILYESINVRSKTFVEEDDAVVLELKTEPEEKKGLEERRKEDQAMEPEGNKNRFVGWTSPAGKLLQQTTERTVSIFSKSTQSTCEVLQALTQPQWWCKSLAYHRPLQGHQLETEASHSLAEDLLHATKLAETSYGQEPCSATEVLLQLAEESFPRDVAMALAYLLAVSEPEAVDAWWEKHVPSEPDLQLAIYYYCLQLYANLITPLSVPQALYEAHPTEVVQEVLSAVMFPLEGMACPHVQHLVKRLRQACERFADFLQAQSLLNLGCGVDVERFAQDADYKRQTILGLAESLEEEPLQLALTLARRYEVPSWEVFLSHTEFLLADNGLSASEVEERITAQDLPGELRNQPEAVLARLACVVFPSLSGRDHARLCTYFGLLKACGCTSHTTHPGQPEAHFQLLQKLHSIAPGLDYKQLVMGESPLEAVRSELTAQNVSALATLLAELPGGPAHSVPVSTLFCNWLHLLFWQGGSMKGDDDASVNETPRHVLSVPTDQRSTEEIQNGQIGETEWLFRFSECEQLMHKMDPPDIGTFLQSICASPHAVSQLLLKVRREILERSMLLVRHLAKMKEEDEIGGEAGYMTVLQQLQDWKSHLDSLDSDVIQALKHNPEARLRDLVKAYDEACSLPDGVRRVALQLALAAQPVNQVNALLELCTRGHVCSVQDVLQEAVRTVLEALRENLKTTTEEEQIEVEQPMDVLDGLVTSIRRHKEEGGKLVSGEDLLGWLRPFCCDEAVPTMQRARVLQLLDRAFPLEEHDLRLLLCYRTKTVLQHSWPERMLKEEEIESEERRLDLFNELLVSKTTTKQLQQLLLLLQAWPAFQPSVLVNERCPWLQLLAAMLNSKPEIQELEQQFERDRPCEEGQHLVAAVREQARTKHPLPYMCLQHLMLLLEKNGFLLLAVCLGLDSNTNELQELALHYATKFSSVEASACSTKLLPIVLSRQLLSACLPTPLYPALAAQLSREKDELSSEAVTQLQDSGQHLHAASMLMAVRGTHPGLTTLSAALALHHCSP